ncbi:MAG: caspase family protein [Nitrospira sp.]|nr:caspase family protein [Nitrospira sp.]MDH4243220.1 caspase family protein [Nitrospira sp.]
MTSSRLCQVSMLCCAIYFGAGCVSDGGLDQAQLELKDPRSADPFDVVNCLLPGQIRQLGTQVTYVTERRPIRTTAEDCAIRGGEYVAMDLADYGTALKVWMSAAQGGDPDAQYYAGVLYEKGAEGSPNYARAAEWYRKAADRGVRRAAINLGRLYEQGLGLERNETEARKWYAKANGTVETTDGGTASGLGSGATAQQELADARAKLTERMSLLEDERRQVEHLKQQLGSSTASAVTAEVVAKQERVAHVRQEEVTKLQAQVTSLKESVQRELARTQTTSSHDKELRGPSIQIIDPLVVMTRGIRVEEGRVAVVIPRGRPHRLTGRVLAEAGIQSLEVNGAPAQFDEQGTFVVQLESLKGATKGVSVDIVAVDRQGKQGSRKLFVSTGEIPAAKDGAIPTTSRAGGYHALVIGNDQYRQWTPLSTAVADAEAMSKILQDRYGFRVTVLKDADRRQILKSLNDYRKTLSDQDHLLVYYAGHGFLEPEIDRGYWIPVEGDLFDNSDWIEFPAVTDLLELIPARQILVVADSCFAGKLTRSAMGRVNPEADEQARQALLKTMAQKKIRATLTSGGAKPVLDEGGAGHSVFATAMLGVLTENNEALETERLYWTVRSRVVQAAERMKFEQIPTYGPIHMAGHEGFGDFVFVPVATSSR